MLKNRTVPLAPAIGTLVLLLGAGTFLVHALVTARSEQETRAARLEAENQGLRDRVAQLEGAAGPHAPAAPGAVRRTAPDERPLEAEALDQARTIIDLREKLAASGASADTLRAQIQDLEAAVQAAKSENAKLAAAEADLRQRGDAANRALASVQADAKSNADKVSQLEADNVRLREEKRAAAVKANAIPAAMKDLDDLDRRREALLTGIVRRYRDITDQYRAMATRLDDARETDPAAGQELGRIHNSISLAEQDLRQLATLNSQASRLHTKISGK